VTGTLEGTVSGAWHYKGTWSGATGARKVPFDLAPVVCGPEFW